MVCSRKATNVTEIRVSPRRSRKDTRAMILDMAKYSDYHFDDVEGVRLETDESV